MPNKVELHTLSETCLYQCTSLQVPQGIGVLVSPWTNISVLISCYLSKQQGISNGLLAANMFGIFGGAGKLGFNPES